MDQKEREFCQIASLAQCNKKIQGSSRLSAERGIVGIAATWMRVHLGIGDRNRVNLSRRDDDLMDVCQRRRTVKEMRGNKKGGGVEGGPTTLSTLL